MKEIPDQDLLRALIRAIRLGRALTSEELPYVEATLEDYDRLRNIKGEVVVSSVDGEVIAVTRQDDDHHILSVIWEKGDEDCLVGPPLTKEVIEEILRDIEENRPDLTG